MKPKDIFSRLRNRDSLESRLAKIQVEFGNGQGRADPKEWLAEVDACDFIPGHANTISHL